MGTSARTSTPSWGTHFGRLSAVVLVFAMHATLALAQQTVMVAFGDSITHGLGDPGVSCTGAPRGYPPRLEGKIDALGYDTRIVTSGVCGELTSEGVSRIDGVLRNHPGRILLLMEGTNDLSNRNISVESMRFNVNAMGAKAESRGYLPVLAAPIPRDERVTDVDNSRTAFFSTLLEQDAAAKDWGFVPAYEELINIPNLYDLYYWDPFHPNSAGYGILANVFFPETLEALQRVLEAGQCEDGDETLCLTGARFRVEVTWTDFEGDTGVGHRVTRTDNTGFFWFFGPNNYELMIKVLDGRGTNGHFWVFYGALSNVGFRITITDVQTGRRKVYDNPVGAMASVGDTTAFPAL